MDLTQSDERKKKFVANVGLITSNGPNGNNITASELTYNVSSSPGLISVSLEPNSATFENISFSNEFGINLAATDQNILAGIAGNRSGKEINKIKVLEDMGYKFFQASKINTLMVEGASMQAECKVIKKIELGSHTMFIGEIIELYPLSWKDTLISYEENFLHLMIVS